MKLKHVIPLLFLLCTASVLPIIEADTPDAGDCAPVGSVQAVCGISAPEDLVAIPGTQWLVAGSLAPGGGLHLIDTRTKETRALYPPGPSSGAKPIPAYAKSCPGGEPDPKTFNAHGLSLRGSNRPNAFRLYAVHHGARETVEVFELRVAGAVPTLAWQGCVRLPEKYIANSVAAFRDGTLLATAFTVPGKDLGAVIKGEVTGTVLRWRLGDTAFVPLPGTELSGNNGIEVSFNQREFYVAATGTQEVVTFSRDPVKRLRATQPLGFLPDNMHFNSDGRLIVAGSIPDQTACAEAGENPDPMKVVMTCPRGFAVAALRPDTLTFDIVAREQASMGIFSVSAAVLVGKELWVGTFTGNRVSYLPLKSTQAPAAR